MRVATVAALLIPWRIVLGLSVFQKSLCAPAAFDGEPRRVLPAGRASPTCCVLLPGGPGCGRTSPVFAPARFGLPPLTTPVRLPCGAGSAPVGAGLGLAGPTCPGRPTICCGGPNFGYGLPSKSGGDPRRHPSFP